MVVVTCQAANVLKVGGAEYLNRLELAEHQFRLACTVHLAVANGVQTFDVPVVRAFGRHRVT